jgi:DNA binding protein with HTH domain
MAVAIQAQQFLDKAAAGEPLTANERRHALLYVQGQNPQVTQRELAAMFGVSESLIRKDIQKIKGDMQDQAKSTYMDTVVQDLIHEQHNVYEAISASLREAKKGSKTYLDHLTARHKVRLDTIRILQDIGALPKSLGEVSVKKEVFKAEVAPGTTQIITRPFDMFDNFEDGEGLEDALARKGRETALEGEVVSSMIALPSPVDMNGQDSNETQPRN